MSVILFRKGGSQLFDEYTFTDRLKEGWFLTEAEAEGVVEPKDSNDDLGDNVEASEEDIIAAISLLEDGNKDHWTTTGKPKVPALEEILGKDIVAAQRDKAWEKVQAEA